MTIPSEIITSLVKTALAEDIGSGDVTTEYTVPSDLRAEGYILAKEPCVLAGLPFVKAIFQELDPTIEIKTLFKEGSICNPGNKICILRGSAQGILTGERTALNFLQRLSGIATMTRQFVEATQGTKAKILDTRKTTPTLRVVEKYAVRIGGGENHRMGLFDAMMVKDNHKEILLRFGKSALADAVTKARKNHSSITVIIEVATLTEVEDALAVKPDRILLDNMTVDEMHDAVALVGDRSKTEASGGVHLSNLAEIASTGVDYISVGALTHSARAIDFSLEFFTDSSE